MPQPVITDYFGSTAEVLTSNKSVQASANAPVLVIPMSALASVGLDDADSMSDPDKVFGAILKLTYLFTKTDTEELSGIEVTTPRKTFITRGNSQKIGYDYSVTVYTADTTPQEFDPDSVI